MFTILVQNFTTLATIAGMMFFLGVNRIFSNKITQIFFFFYIDVLVLYFGDVFDTYYKDIGYYVPDHFVSTAIGYMCRPLSLFFVISVVNRRRKINYLLLVFLIIEALVVITSNSSHLVFWYDQFNVYHRGPLGYISHITSAVMGILLVIFSFLNYKNISLSEATIILFIVVISFIATIIENVYGYDFILVTAIALSGLFYFMFLHSQLYKCDQLTGVLNRRCFFIELKNTISIPKSFISCDMNGLKKINDDEGHLAGDKAIITFSTALCDAKKEVL